MKFLKKDVSEANAVASIVDKIALSNPDVSIRFIREGKNTLFTSGSGDLKTTAYEIFGKDFSDGLIEADYSFESVQISGLISKPTKSLPPGEVRRGGHVGHRLCVHARLLPGQPELAVLLRQR